MARRLLVLKYVRVRSCDKASMRTRPYCLSNFLRLGQQAFLPPDQGHGGTYRGCNCLECQHCTQCQPWNFAYDNPHLGCSQQIPDREDSRVLKYRERVLHMNVESVLDELFPASSIELCQVIALRYRRGFLRLSRARESIDIIIA
jgi:hypothetical protein